MLCQMSDPCELVHPGHICTNVRVLMCACPCALVPIRVPVYLCAHVWLEYLECAAS